MNDLSKIKDFIHNMWIWSFPKNEYPKSSKVTSWPVDQFSIETHGFSGDLVRNPYVCICQCIEYRAQCIRYGELNTSIESTTLCNTIYIYIAIYHQTSPKLSDSGSTGTLPFPLPCPRHVKSPFLDWKPRPCSSISQFGFGNNTRPQEVAQKGQQEHWLGPAAGKNYQRRGKANGHHQVPVQT